jgi:hypothetical protein
LCQCRWSSSECLDLTGNTSEKLPSKALDLTVWEWDKSIALEKVKDALAKEIHDDANVPTEIEAVSKMYASVAVLVVICLECRKNSQLDFGRIPVFLDRSNDLDGHVLLAIDIMRKDNFTESALS